MVKQPASPNKNGPQQKRQQALVYVDESEEAVNYGKDGNEYSKPALPAAVIVGDLHARNVGKSLVLQTKNQFATISRSASKNCKRGRVAGERSQKKSTDVCCGALGSNILLKDDKREIIEKFKKMINELEETP